MDKITQINKVLQDYFRLNTSVNIIPAKDLMPIFIKAGVFPSDQKNGLPIRKLLRTLDEKKQLHLIPFVYAKRNSSITNWFFKRANYTSTVSKKIETSIPKDLFKKTKTSSRKNSDEHYVIDLCDVILKKTGLRQHRFDFLLGDPNAKGVCSKLPVDVYYPELNLVIEFKEQQHTKANKHFDKPSVKTVSGVHRGEQRLIYDLRRAKVLPKNGIQLIEISYELFEYTKQGKIIRDKEKDLKRVQEFLKNKRNGM